MERANQPIHKYVIGCSTCPKITSVYAKEKLSKWPWSSRSPHDTFKDLHYPLTWSNGFCGGRGKIGALVEKRQRPMAKECCYNNFLVKLFVEEKMKTK